MTERKKKRKKERKRVLQSGNCKAGVAAGPELQLGGNRSRAGITAVQELHNASHGARQ